MNKRYLPAIAAIFILVLTALSFAPVMAASMVRAKSLPTLQVVTIPEDDEIRKTGVILLGMPWVDPHEPVRIFDVTYGDFLAQFKLLVSYNGVPVAADLEVCQVIEKDKVNPLKDKQFFAENLRTVPKDMSEHFICKVRWGKPGVGVIDVYYVGPIEVQYISDYVLVVGFSYAIGRTLVWGTEMQDICVLGWPQPAPWDWPNGVPYVITKPDKTEHGIYPDPMGIYASCEELSLVQKELMFLLPSWT